MKEIFVINKEIYVNSAVILQIVYPLIVAASLNSGLSKAAAVSFIKYKTCLYDKASMAAAMLRVEINTTLNITYSNI